MTLSAAQDVCGAATLVKEEGYRLQAKCPRCKSWNCPECAPLRAKNLRILAIHGQPNAMLTLAIKPREGETHEQGAKRLKGYARKLYRQLRARHGIDWPYLEVGEAHQDGRLHIHTLIHGWQYVHKWTLKKMWRKITGGSWTASIDRIKPGRASYYVTKYLSKAPAKWGKLKRYVVSKSWKRPEKPELPVADAFVPTRVEKGNITEWVYTQVRQGGLLIRRDGRTAEVWMPP